MNTFADWYDVFYYNKGQLVGQASVDVYLGIIDVAVKRVAERLKIEYDDYKATYNYTES